MDIMNLKKMSKVDSDEIWVNEFDEESAQNFRAELMDAAKGDSKKPIVVYIDSYGGYVDSLAKMIEAMDEVSNPIITVCHGKAMSCGAVLLSHGDIRFVGVHSRVMVHEVSSGAAGDVHDMHADALETQRLNKWFMGLLARNCGIKGGYDALRKTIKGQDGRNRYMDANQAVAFGIADAVGTPRIGQCMQYDISVAPPKRRMRDEKKSKPVKLKKTKKGKTDTTKRS
jgi:ATP-dependent Clp protease protease subunit